MSNEINNDSDKIRKSRYKCDCRISAGTHTNLGIENTEEYDILRNSYHTRYV